MRLDDLMKEESVGVEQTGLLGFVVPALLLLLLFQPSLQTPDTREGRVPNSPLLLCLLS